MSRGNVPAGEGGILEHVILAKVAVIVKILYKLR